jgi:hypothetical protein
MSLVILKRLKVEYISAAPSREQPGSIFIDEQKRIRDTLRADRDHKQWHFVNLRGADVLTVSETSKRPKDKNDKRARARHDLLLIRLLDLNNFFGDKTVSRSKPSFAAIL